MKSGYISIFGKPNAGKSTLLNALLGEKLAIVSSKVQTTRHRIKGFLNKPGEYQLVFSDTPGIIESKYKLHEKMMGAVKSALEDADLALLIVDGREDPTDADAIFEALRLRVPAIVVLNKADKAKKVNELKTFFSSKSYCKEVAVISALQEMGIDELKKQIFQYIPDGEPFFPEDDLSDLSTRFFIGEIIREKVFELLDEEIPYQTAVMVNEFKEKQSLIKIQADIIVQRDTQKSIVIGEKGSMIRSIGMAARTDIEKFIGSKVFLELFVKVRPKWRDNDLMLKEYGYF